MSLAPWIATAGGRDPSTPLALMALLRSADDAGVASFDDFVTAYREVIVSGGHMPASSLAAELRADEIRGYLGESLLPRMADEGWVAAGQPGDWQEVRAQGPWWPDAAHDRGAATAALLAASQRGSGQRRSKPSAAPPAGRSVLEGIALTKEFRGRRVVNDVSVRLEQGEIVGLLGPNGAGKTTTFYLITGLIRPDGGRVTLDGEDITKAPMYRRARRGIGYLAQEPSVFRRMTVEENVLAILETRKLPRREQRAQLERMLDELSIKHLRRNRAYSLSGGERRRLEITRALVAGPKFMLLDEPFAGVDPIAVHDIQTIVAGLRHRGLGVLITDHNVEQTLDIVDRAYIMFEGKVQAAGTVRELVFDDRVAQLYLGPTLTARLRARMEATA